MTVWSRLDLGVGLIAAGGVDLLWPDLGDLVDVVEVEPQTLWDHTLGDGRQLEPRALGWLRSLERPLLSHGVGFPVGGIVPPDTEGVRASARSAAELDAVHWSEHLSFNRTGAGGDHAGYLLPPMPTEATVAAAVSHIGLYRSQDERPFLVETPTSYLRPVPGDLSDGELVARIAIEADCGILLDLHNIWANELNGRQSVEDFLRDIPLERVWEVHLAGGFAFEGFHLDAHVGAVAQPLLEIAAAVIPRLPHVRALLFEAVPESVVDLGVPGLRGVLEQLHLMADLPAAPFGIPAPATPSEAMAVPSTAVAVPSTAVAVPSAGTRSSGERESQLLAYTTRATDTLPGADPGAAVLRLLTDEARLSLLVDGHADDLRGLLTRYGRTGTRELLNRFLAETRASSWPTEQSAAFSAWLSEHHELANHR